MKGNKEFKVRTSKSYWMSKNILLFAKSPKFDYESYHKIFSSILSTTSINNSNIFNDGELSVLFT